MRGTAHVGLWTGPSLCPIDVHVMATKLALPDLELLARRHDPVTGTLDGTISISGSKDNPSGNGSLSLRQATAWNEPINNLTVGFKGTGNSIRSKVQLQIPAGGTVATVTYSPKTEQYDVDVSASRFKLEMLKTIQARNAGIAGVLTLSAGVMALSRIADANVNIANRKSGTVDSRNSSAARCCESTRKCDSGQFRTDFDRCEGRVDRPANTWQMPRLTPGRFLSGSYWQAICRA